ncbi:hypothetical protein ACHQM5_026549 [Ranunculus cassubicifolius]
MGQALRRAASRTTSSSSSSPIVKNIERPPSPPQPPLEKASPVPKVELKSKSIKPDDPNQDDARMNNSDNVLEEKDSGYDAMLSQMVGRIKTKPGGKLEMGDAFIVEKYDRPMPKLRNTKSEPSYDEEAAAPPGTLNVAQLREVLRLHRGKTKDANEIAKSFRMDVAQVEKILQFVSLPPENNSGSKQQGK